MSLGYHTMPLPRGVRKGDVFVHGRDLVEASGSNHHRVIAICESQMTAVEVAVAMNRRRGRAKRSRR